MPPKYQASLFMLVLALIFKPIKILKHSNNENLKINIRKPNSGFINWVAFFTSNQCHRPVDSCNALRTLYHVLQSL